MEDAIADWNEVADRSTAVDIVTALVIQLWTAIHLHVTLLSDANQRNVMNPNTDSSASELSMSRVYMNTPSLGIGWALSVGNGSTVAIYMYPAWFLITHIAACERGFKVASLSGHQPVN